MMKTVLTSTIYILISLSLEANDMIDTLKTLIEKKDVANLIRLVEEHPDILNSKDENGSSGFMIITYSGLDEVFKKAIKLKKEFSFHEAIVSGKTEVVKKHLAASNSSIENSYSPDGFTPLSLAAFFDQTEIAQILVDEGADPNVQAKNPSKVNALHSAVAKENYELCQLFLENGADPNAVQTQSVTPLHSAAHRGNLRIVRLLVEKGAQIDAQMDNGDTAATIAERDGHHEIKEYLMGIKAEE